jgi:hypothetical protein
VLKCGLKTIGCLGSLLEVLKLRRQGAISELTRRLEVVRQQLDGSKGRS